MRAYLMAVLVLNVLCFGQTPQAPQAKPEVGWGYIEGTVVEIDGKPLAGATLTAWTDGKGLVRDVSKYFVDDAGKFKLKFPEGEVWLTAHKDSEGYPYAFFAFYNMPGQDFPHVKVKAGETTKDVVVRVGIKAAHIKYEAVDDQDEKPIIDDNTRKPFAGGFALERLDQAGKPFYTSGPLDRDLLVPPDTPFRLTFDGAKGYKPWHYGGDKWQGKEGLISLKSGEVLNLTMRLQREQGATAASN